MSSFFLGKGEEDKSTKNEVERIAGEWNDSDDGRWYEFTNENDDILFSMSHLCLTSNPCQHNIRLKEQIQPGPWGGIKIYHYLQGQGIPMPTHFNYLEKRFAKEAFIKRIQAGDLSIIEDNQYKNFDLDTQEVIKIAWKAGSTNIVDKLIDNGYKPDNIVFIEICKTASVENFKQIVGLGLDPFSASESLRDLKNTVFGALKGNNYDLLKYMIVDLKYPLDTNYNKKSGKDAKYLINYAKEWKCDPRIINLIEENSKEQHVKYHADVAYPLTQKGDWKQLQSMLEEDLFENPDVVIQRIIYKAKNKPYLPIVTYLKNTYPQYRNLFN